ncbi:MAG: hypothetical protein WCS69_08130 [Ignavibacteriaceae bacterium]|jgi:hypothetical protein
MICEAPNITNNIDFWMLLITIINMLLILFTWLISYRATNKIFENSTRPIVGILEFNAYRTEKDELNFVIKYKNYGNTPARETEIVFETFLNKKSLSIEQNPNYIFILSPSEEDSHADLILRQKCKEIYFQKVNSFEISVKIFYKGITNIKYYCYERYYYSHDYKQFVMVASSWNKLFGKHSFLDTTYYTC